MLKLKKALALAAVSGALVGLAGCTSLETVKQTPNSVIEVAYNIWTGERELQYVDSDRQLKALPECGQPSFWEKRYCETKDRSVRFEYVTNKSGLAGGVLFVNGEEHELSCSLTSGGELRGCTPKS